MDSYKKLKEEMDSLQTQIEKLNLEKEKVLDPLYEIASEYNNYLGNILPPNISATKNLNLRLTVFEEEVKTMPIADSKKEEILKIIESTKNKIKEKNNQLKNINEKMSNLSPLYEQRRNYILEKIEKIKPLKEEIKELERQIDLHKKYLQKTTWSKKTEDIFINVIEDYQNQINEKTLLISLIVEDEIVAEDISLLSGLDVEPQYKYQEEVIEDVTIDENDVKLTIQIDNNIEDIAISQGDSDIKIPIQVKNNIEDNKEKNPTIKPLKAIFEEKLQDFYSYTSVSEERNNEESVQQERPKQKELSEDQKTTLRKLRNIFEDQTNDIKQDTQISVTKIQQNEDEFEEDFLIDDIHYNYRLQDDIEEEKGLRIKLGLANISSRISKLLPQKEHKTVKRTRELYKKLKK